MKLIALLVRWIALAVVWFGHRTELYAAWSRHWRTREPGARNWPIPRILRSVREAEDLLGRHNGLWRADPWWRGWDLISLPSKLEAAISWEEKRPHFLGEKPSHLFDKGLDCDEFATWSCEVLGRMAEVLDVQLLQVVWRQDGDPWWKLRGHHVCLFRREAGWFHLGNWGLLGPFPSALAAAQSIGRTGFLCAWRSRRPTTLRDWEPL